MAMHIPLCIWNVDTNSKLREKKDEDIRDEMFLQNPPHLLPWPHHQVTEASGAYKDFLSAKKERKLLLMRKDERT